MKIYNVIKTGILAAMILLVISGIAMAASLSKEPWYNGYVASKANVSDSAWDHANENAVFNRGGLDLMENSANKRAVFINRNNPGAEVLKGILDVRHEFPKGFTVDVTSTQLSLLNLLGVETENVGTYHILARPVCGDEVCQGNEPTTCPEDCGNPELYCGDGICNGDETPESCPADCSLPDRLCYPDESMPWGITKVNGGTGGAGVTVAVLDTGVYKDHLDLKDNIVSCKDATKRGIRDGCVDTIGHGTHVAGTIAANGGSDGLGIYGVAPNASLMIIKVCGRLGCRTDDIAEGIYYATDNEAKIISMSLGGDTQSSLIMDAIDYATNNGVLVVAAAGNDGPADGSIDYPGANVNVVAVGAIDIDKNVVSWSSRGINDGDYVVEEREVEFGAPGVSVESTWKDGCYNIIQGTSMATPHVAGLAAKL